MADNLPYFNFVDAKKSWNLIFEIQKMDFPKNPKIILKCPYIQNWLLNGFMRPQTPFPNHIWPPNHVGWTLKKSMFFDEKCIFRDFDALTLTVSKIADVIQNAFEEFRSVLEHLKSLPDTTHVTSWSIEKIFFASTKCRFLPFLTQKRFLKL